MIFNTAISKIEYSIIYDYLTQLNDIIYQI